MKNERKETITRGNRVDNDDLVVRRRLEKDKSKSVKRKSKERQKGR